ncbi:MAG TPA: hypothetical protein VFM74_07880, partial [Candidatus Limnocylindria bacterium]|nr:hypothetical protein [Candidatus Limnocylindria bacterium]
MTQNGKVYPIAASQTFYDDETPWGAQTQRLADDVERDVAAEMDTAAPYDRQDRGVQAVAYYLISRQWRDGDSCSEGGEWCKPHRALQMPGILSEVGSISLEAEQDLLVTPAGQQAAAEGVYRGLVRYFGDRPLAVSYDALVRGGAAGEQPAEVAGNGPPFLAPRLPAGSDPLPLRLTNSGTQPWPSGLRLVAGWQASELPYLADAPPELDPLDVAVPALAPGQSVELRVSLQAPAGGDRQLVWISLAGDADLSTLGSPALQLATRNP